MSQVALTFRHSYSLAPIRPSQLRQTFDASLNSIHRDGGPQRRCPLFKTEAFFSTTCSAEYAD